MPDRGVLVLGQQPAGQDGAEGEGVGRLQAQHFLAVLGRLVAPAQGPAGVGQGQVRLQKRPALGMLPQSAGVLAERLWTKVALGGGESLAKVTQRLPPEGVEPTQQQVGIDQVGIELKRLLSQDRLLVRPRLFGLLQEQAGDRPR